MRVLGRSHAQISRILPRGQGRGLGGGELLQVFFWNELEGETITVGEI